MNPLERFCSLSSVGMEKDGGSDGRSGQNGVQTMLYVHGSRKRKLWIDELDVLDIEVRRPVCVVAVGDTHTQLPCT